MAAQDVQLYWFNLTSIGRTFVGQELESRTREEVIVVELLK